MDQLLKLLDLLTSERFQSGQDLAVRLGVSRASISAWVGKLVELGIDINVIKGRGYRLVSEVDLIDRHRVVALLDEKTRGRVSHVDIKGETASTNDDALAAVFSSQAWHVYATELQSKGKGRRGRIWQSPFAQNLMFSVARKAHFSTEALYSASLIAGVAVAKALKQYSGLSVGLKWPNDVYVNDQKLAGILCEMQGNPQDEPLLVIGIGINVNFFPNNLDYSACSLKSLGVARRDRTALLASVIDHLVDEFSRDSTEHVAQVLELWRGFDILKDRHIAITKGENVTYGVAQGVDSKGQLIVLNDDGQSETLNGGEVSVRW